MKKFIAHIVLFFLPILVYMTIAEIALRNIPNDYSYKKKYLDENSNNIEILFLGNSHMYYGINPQYDTLKSFNASHISQSLNFDLSILEKYKNAWSNLKYIVIPADYFSMYTTLEKGEEDWRVKNYTIYYGINKYSTYRNNFEIINGKAGFNLIRLLNFYYKGSSEITCNKLGWGTIFHSENNMNLIETAQQSVKRHTVIKDSLCFANNIHTLKSIIEFAKQINARVIFLTSPAYKTYYKNLDQQQLNSTIHTISKLASQHKNTYYYNLLTDQSFNEDDFYDADHLNESGAKKLTFKMDSIITKLNDQLLSFQQENLTNQ